MRAISKVLRVCCTSIVIPLTITLIQVVAQLSRKGFPGDLYDTVLG